MSQLEKPKLGQTNEESPRERENLSEEQESITEGKVNKQEIPESSELEKEIERESEKLTQNLETLGQNITEVEKTDVSKNELPFKVLGAKVKDICNNLIGRLQQMDKEKVLNYAMIGSMIAGAAVAGVNLAGLEDKFHLASYIPDALTMEFPRHEHINAANPVKELLEQIGIKSNPASEALAEQHPVVQLLKSLYKMDTPQKRGFANFAAISSAGSLMGAGIGMIIKKLNTKK